MLKGKLIDVLSVIVALAIGGDLVYTHTRLRRLEQTAGGSPSLQQKLTVGTKFLPAKAVDLTGRQVNITPGRKRLIFYFSTHCGVCAQQIADWGQVAQTLGPENVLFVSADDVRLAKKDVSNYLAANGLQGFTAITIDNTVMKDYGMYRVPQTLLVSKDGRVRKLWIGGIKHEELLDQWKVFTPSS